MPTVKEITGYLDSLAPPALQESYDNAGLLAGAPDAPVEAVLVTLDCTEAVVAEATARGANLIVAHHPVIFGGLKRLTGSHYSERTVMAALRQDIALYAIHTNLDKVMPGVSSHLAGRLGLEKVRVLRPEANLHKLVTFIPAGHTRQVLGRLYAAGAGNIGNYSECSFRVTGTGTFKPSEAANPAIGRKLVREEVKEERVEVIYPAHLSGAILQALREAHPYEEVAYYETALQNLNQDNGLGAIGTLPEPLEPAAFLAMVKERLGLPLIRHTRYSKPVSRVAVCGGSGSFLLSEAMQAGADAYLTGDIKYHDFFEADGRILFGDIGHYESEAGTKELLRDLLTKKFTNFAVHLSETETNPIQYF